MESCSKDKYKVKHRSQLNIQHPHKTESRGQKYEKIGHMHERILRKCCICRKIENVSLDMSSLNSLSYCSSFIE